MFDLMSLFKKQSLKEEIARQLFEAKSALLTSESLKELADSDCEKYRLRIKRLQRHLADET